MHSNDTIEIPFSIHGFLNCNQGSQCYADHVQTNFKISIKFAVKINDSIEIPFSIHGFLNCNQGSQCYAGHVQTNFKIP